MLYAFLSDIHGRLEKLEAALADARERGAEQIVCLGDVGGDECLARLRDASAVAVFGNYEVSGWQRLSPENRAWVQAWPPLLAGDSFLAVHAAPWWPEGLRSIADFTTWQQRSGSSWRALFPYLNEDPDYVWQALAELEKANATLLFHGHTHRQMVQRCGPEGRLRQVKTAALTTAPDHRYVIGVGSVGLPDESGWSRYALYDEAAGRVELIRMERPEGA